MVNARLYEVHSARGIIYALHDLTSGTIWTERSEHSVRAFAKERGLTIIEEQVVSHEELLRRMGHEPPITRPPAPAPASAAKQEPAPAPAADYMAVNPASSAIPPLQVQYHWDDSPLLKADDAIVIPRGALKSVRNVFCSEGQVTDSAGSNVGQDAERKK